jgi:hypothetical protein
VINEPRYRSHDYIEFRRSKAVFLIAHQRRVALVALGVLTFTGCTARSQQSTVSEPKLPAAGFASPNPSPSPLRGLQGVIPGTAEIIPGQSVGPLRLGDSRERSFDLFGKPGEEYAFDAKSPCFHTELHWNDLEHEDRWGIYAYARDNRIYQIEADTPRYATAEGITSDSSPEEVRRTFPNTQAYVLLHSGSKLVGGKDLIYWVDQTAGIGFEFYYHPKLDKRRLASTIVFTPGTDFAPDGCVSPPQELVKLKPFTLESESEN